MKGLSAQKHIDEKSPLLVELAKKIWETPEIAYKEYNACQWTAEALKKEGFEVEVGYAGLPTAIRASWGNGKPVIGLLGEYDALPGMSQKISTVKEPVAEGDAGHACGHNLLGAAHVGAAIGMKKEMQERNLRGTVVFYGCPAEKALTGKVFMARNGAFRDLDISFAWHPGTENAVSTGAMTALNTAKFHFKGITAHAGGDPHNGRSALDAAELMNVGANFLREHVADDVRIHYVVTNGGTAPNIVPDKASNWYYMRAFSREAVADTYERLIKVAKGAAMMTETEVEAELLGGCYNTLQNKVLVNLVHETMQEVGLPEWSGEELEFAEKLDRVSANYKAMVDSGRIKEGIHIHQEVSPVGNDNAFGSTDVGDVQHIAPGVFFTTATSNIGAAGHSWQNTACAGNSIGIKGMLYGAKIMAVAGINAMEDKAIIDEAKKEFNSRMGSKKYECPIPEEVPVPQGN